MNLIEALIFGALYPEYVEHILLATISDGVVAGTRRDGECSISYYHGWEGQS